MPSAVVDHVMESGITKLTNCRLVVNTTLVEQDLWLSTETGKILPAQTIFYNHRLAPDRVIDLNGRIVAPGFIDTQFNGAYGFDFSQFHDKDSYQEGARALNKKLVETGLTSYLPTIITQRPELYHQALPFLGPSGSSRLGADGAESLGAHVEGPFLSPTKKGVHNIDILRTADNGFTSLEDCYGAKNLESSLTSPPSIKMITAAPEVEGVMDCISELAQRGIVFSMGHTESDYETAAVAIEQGASMITHLFNAMKPLHHRNPGIFGLMGQDSGAKRPYFGIIADGIHLHASTVKIAWNAHPEGMILVTDALAWMGMEDGTYEWINGDRIVKRGPNLTKDGTNTIAGGCASLLQCLNNFLHWTGASIPEGVASITSIPAKMLGVYPQKGSLEAGADADLCVLSESVVDDNGLSRRELRVEQVWKFGDKIFDREE